MSTQLERLPCAPLALAAHSIRTEQSRAQTMSSLPFANQEGPHRDLAPACRPATARTLGCPLSQCLHPDRLGPVDPAIRYCSRLRTCVPAWSQRSVEKSHQSAVELARRPRNSPRRSTVSRGGHACSFDHHGTPSNNPHALLPLPSLLLGGRRGFRRRRSGHVVAVELALKPVQEPGRVGIDPSRGRRRIEPRGLE